MVGRHLSGYHLPEAERARLRVLSPKEYLVLQAVARRILRADGSDAPSPDELEVARFADGYLAGLPAPLASDVKSLLQLFEHGSWVFRLRGSRFTRMTPEEQDATLEDWAESGLAVRRQGFQALRTLCFLGYYRHDRTWPLLAYSGPLVGTERKAAP